MDHKQFFKQNLKLNLSLKVLAFHLFSFLLKIFGLRPTKAFVANKHEQNM